MTKQTQAPNSDDDKSAFLSEHERLQAKIRSLETQVQRLLADNKRLNQQWQQATVSISWRLITKLSQVGKQLVPQGSLRRRAIKFLWRNMMSLRHNGPLAWFRRTLARSRSKFMQFSKDLIAGMRPFLMDERPVIMAVSHVGGGGTERHVRDMAARLLQENVRTIYARPNLHGRLVFEERDANWNVRWRRAVGANSDKIAELLNRLKPNLAHIHHTMGVPERLFQELCKLEVPTDWTLHDYHCICPRIHLHDERGQYCNEPDTDACNRCLRQRGDYHERSVAVQIEKYREDWAGRLATARRIYVPSDDTNRRISRHFQHLRIETRPHMEPSWPEHAAAVPHVPGEPVRVAVIGSIGPIKGAYPLLDAARDAAQRNLPIEFVLVGTSSLEPQLLATGRVELTGPYYEHEIWDRLQGLSCHLAWLPSIWPETYMYTLSIAQMSSLWPVVYDLGAQAERILESGIGDSISLETPPDQMNDLFLKRACQLATQPLPQPLQYAQYPNFLEDYYGLTWQQLKLLGVQAMNEIPYEQNVGPFSHKPPQPHASRSDHARLHQHHSQLSS